MRTVDLFCGAGGSSAGARLAGATIVGAIDACPLAAATFRANFPEARVVCDRLDDSNGPSLFGDIGQVDLLLASPECTNHSVARGNRAVCSESQRSAAYVLPFIKAWRPSFVVIENVTRMRRWSGWEDFQDTMRAAGYRLDLHVLDASDFGVPQTRRRMFLVCSREGAAPIVVNGRGKNTIPASSIIAPKGEFHAWPVKGRKRALAEATMGRISRGLGGTGEGADFLIVYYGSDAAGGWQSLDRPLRTVTTLDRFGLVQKEADGLSLRMLQVPELRRAMGFPADFRFDCGSRRDRIRMLGNAVCPPVMEAIVKSLRQVTASEDERQPVVMCA